MTLPSTPALQIKGLKKTYATGVEALHGIDLEVQRGDFFALLGPNGAGKSTAIGIISSLVTFSEGSVSIFGHDIVRDYAAARACLGLVPQEFNFNQFDLIYDILMHQAGYFGIRRQDAAKRTQELLEQFDLWGKRLTIARDMSGGISTSADDCACHDPPAATPDSG